VLTIKLEFGILISRGRTKKSRSYGGKIMKTLYFKNTLTGRNNATYLPCNKPSTPDKFTVEIVNVPDEIEPKTVAALLNKTVVWKANIIDYSTLGEGKLITRNWGGKREGSGRPSTGRKKQQFYITDEEAEQIKNFIDTLRKPSK
jgi:hypothetical protein